jgi:hypothetical protein
MVHLVQKTRAKNSHAWAPLRAADEALLNKVLVHNINRLDQGHLYPIGEHPGEQTISFALPGIEPWSPAPQAGTLP